MKGLLQEPQKAKSSGKATRTKPIGGDMGVTEILQGTKKHGASMQRVIAANQPLRTLRELQKSTTPKKPHKRK